MSRLIDTRLDGADELVWTRNDVEVARLDSSGNITTKGNVNGGSSPATKRVTLAIGSDNATTNTVAVTDFLQRIPILLPVTTTRWRLRVRNSRLSGGTIAGNMTLTDVYVGTPAFSSLGIATDAFTAAPTRAISSSGSTWSDTEYVSPWVTDSSLQFQADIMAMLSYGWTNLVNQVISYNGTASGGAKSVGIVYTGSGASSSAGSTSPGGSRLTGPLYGDVRLEYETLTTLPVVLIVSDSTGIGWTDDATKVGFIYAAQTVNGWPAQAALRERFCWVNASVQGAVAGDFVSANDARFTRFDLTTNVPDAAIINVGINDASNATALATWQATYQTIVASLRAMGIKRIYAATIIPQPQFKGGVVLTGVASGVTTMSTSIAFANADVVTVDYGAATAETLTVSGASTGTGPYTTTFTGSSTQAHAPFAPISINKELRRRDYNDYLRGIPNTTAVFDFAKAVADGNYPVSGADPVFYGTGTIHPGVGGYLAMATQVRIPTWAIV